MKTLTFILYFVAILGLIEAKWRVTDQFGLSSQEQSDFKEYVQSAMLQGGGDDDKIQFLRKKMEQEHGGKWSCFFGNFKGSWRSYKSITVKKGINEVVCFQY